MGRDRFVTPETVRVSLSGGDWIEVKKRLTARERKQVAGANLGVVLPDGSRKPDWQGMAFDSVLVYLVAWSFRKDDKPVPVNRDAIENLTEEDFAELDAAVTAHEKAMQDEATEAKKDHGETAA